LKGLPLQKVPTTIEVGGKAVSRIVVENIPDKLRNAFKAYCAMKGSDMRTELLAYMEKVTAAVAAKRSKR